MAALVAAEVQAVLVVVEMVDLVCLVQAAHLELQTLVVAVAVLVEVVVPVSSSLLTQPPKYLKNSNEYTECKSNTTSRKRSDSNNKCCEYYCEFFYDNR